MDYSDEINDVMNQLLQPTSAPPKKPPKPSRPPTKRAQPTQNQQKSTQRQQNTQNTAHSRPISNREAVAPLLNPRVDRTQYGLTSTVANNTSPQSTQVYSKLDHKKHFKIFIFFIRKPLKMPIIYRRQWHAKRLTNCRRLCLILYREKIQMVLKLRENRCHRFV